jgi:hypothetical protein
MGFPQNVLMCVFLRFREVFLCGLPFPSFLVVTGMPEADFHHASPYVYPQVPYVFLSFSLGFVRISSGCLCVFSWFVRFFHWFSSKCLYVCVPEVS